VPQISKPAEQQKQEGVYEKLNFTSNAPKAPTRPTNPFAEDVQKSQSSTPSTPVNQQFSPGPPPPPPPPAAAAAYEQRTEPKLADRENSHGKYSRTFLKISRF
jgi:hypothetical protein